MINLVLYLDSEELWDCGGEKLHIEQALGQKSWELRKLYGLPEIDSKEENSVFSALEERIMFGSGEEVQTEIIKNISIQIGNNQEWRLLLFLASEKKPFGDEYFWLQKFLSQMMYYGDGSDINRLPGLTCELPEQIWIITLKDTSTDDITSTGIQYYDRAVHGNEQIYAAYPPNCRFICYGLDYRKENYFDKEMLKMHCSIRCLARPLFPSDLLKGNHIYLLEAEWDEEKLCSEINEYDSWLCKIKKRIENIRQNLKEEWLDDSVIARPIVPVTTGLDIKKDGQKLTEIKRKAENAIEKLNIEQRRIFKQYQEELNESLKRQEGHILLKTRESVLKENMYGQEKNMYKNTVRKHINVKQYIYIIIKELFNLKNWFTFENKNNRKEKKLEPEKEIYNYDNRIQVMKQDKFSQIAETIVYINLCFLITWFAGTEIGENNKFYVFIVYMAIISICAIIVFYSFIGIYQFRRKQLYKMFVDIQEERVISNENYFKFMLDYFRLKSILNFHVEQKKNKSMQEKVYEQWEQDRKKYNEICNKLKISFDTMEIEEYNVRGRGNIQEMLQKGQYEKLYSLYEKPAELTVNGVIIFVPFTFIKKIKLTNIYNIQ